MSQKSSWHYVPLRNWTEFTYQFGGAIMAHHAHHHSLQLTCHHHGQLGVPTTHCYASHHPCPSLPVASHKCQALALSWGMVLMQRKKKLTTPKYIWRDIVFFLKNSHFEQFYFYILHLGWIQGFFPSLNKFPWQNEVHCPSTVSWYRVGWSSGQKVPWHISRWNPQFPKSLAILDVFPLVNTCLLCMCIYI